MIHSSEKLVEVQRADIKESSHHGHIVVVNDTGEVLHAIGNPDELVFARSAAKPLQAIAIMDHGAVEKYQFEANEISLMCASHNGEAIHVNAVNKMLKKLDLDETYLTCGIHPPFHKETAQSLSDNHIPATTLHNNCSGKHSGMLALAKSLSVAIEGYAQPTHPVQAEMIKVVSEMANISIAEMKIGIDGCGVPVFGMPLKNLALAYACFGTGAGCSPQRTKSVQTILRAIKQYPEYLAGDDRYDTLLIRTTAGRIIGKMGAEGVFALTIPSEHVGISFKVEDGNFRALYPTVTEALHQLGYLTEEEYKTLCDWHPAILRNHAGTEVGKIATCFHF